MNDELNSLKKETWQKMIHPISDEDVNRMETLRKLLKYIDETELAYTKAAKTPGKYEDPDFEPKKKIVETMEDLMDDIEWKRIEDYYHSPFFQNIDTNSITQGELGDCYLISALLFIAKNPELVSNIFRSINGKHGCACVYFNVFGRKIPMIVDTLMPFRDDRLKFSEPRTKEDSAWFVLIEKAFAKLSGSFSNIVGGEVQVTLFLMLGWFPYSISVREIKPADLWKKLVECNKMNYMLGCSINHPEDDPIDCESKNLHTNHSYIILDLAECEGKKFIKCRNPWGNGEWNGDWSNESELWTESMKKKMLKDMESGAFWMILKDWMNFFTKISISIPPNESWYKKTQLFVFRKGEQDGRRPRRGFNKTGYLDQFTLTFKEKGMLNITIEKIGPKDLYHAIVFQKRKGQRIDQIDRKDSGVSYSYETNGLIDGVQVNIDEIDEPWTFLVTRNKSDVKSWVFITFSCEKPFKLKELPLPDFTKMHSGKGSTTFLPGEFDGLFPIWCDAYDTKGITMYRQWRIKFNKAATAYLEVERTGAETIHNVFLEQIDEYQKSKMMTTKNPFKQYECGKTAEKELFVIDFDDKSWNLIFTRDACDERSNIAFKIHSDTEFTIEQYPEVDKTYHKYTFESEMVPGEYDGLDRPKALQSYLIEAKQRTTVIGRFRKLEAPLVHHIIFLRSMENEQLKSNVVHPLDKYDEFVWILEPNSYKITVARQAGNEDTKYKLEIFTDEKVNMEIMERSCYESLTKVIIEDTLQPGELDGRNPATYDYEPNVLPQFEINLKENYVMEFYIERKEKEAEMSVCFLHCLDGVVTFFQRTNLVKADEQGSSEDFPDIEKPWYLVVCREKCKIPSPYKLTCHYDESKMDLNLVKRPIYSKLKHFCITTTLKPGESDGKSGWLNEKGFIDHLPQWVFTFKKKMDAHFSMRIKNSQSIHYVALHPCKPPEKIRFYKYDTHVFKTGGKSGLDRWGWPVDEGTYTLAVTRLKADDETKIQIDVYGEFDFSLKEFDGNALNKCTKVHDNDPIEPKVTFVKPNKKIKVQKPRMTYEKPGEAKEKELKLLKSKIKESAGNASLYINLAQLSSKYASNSTDPDVLKEILDILTYCEFNNWKTINCEWLPNKIPNDFKAALGSSFNISDDELNEDYKNVYSTYMRIRKANASKNIILLKNYFQEKKIEFPVTKNDTVLKTYLDSKKRFLVDRKDIKVINTLAQRPFYSVYKAKQVSTNLNVFVKDYHVNFKIEGIENEIWILTHKKDTRFPKITGICASVPFWIMFENPENGNLKEMLPKLSDNQLTVIIYELAEAFAFLKTQKINHHDISIDNIWLDSQFIPKINDFSKSVIDDPKDIDDDIVQFATLIAGLITDNHQASRELRKLIRHCSDKSISFGEVVQKMQELKISFKDADDDFITQYYEGKLYNEGEILEYSDRKLNHWMKTKIVDVEKIPTAKFLRSPSFIKNLTERIVKFEDQSIGMLAITKLLDINHVSTFLESNGLNLICKNVKISKDLIKLCTKQTNERQLGNIIDAIIEAKQFDILNNIYNSEKNQVFVERIQQLIEHDECKQIAITIIEQCEDLSSITSKQLIGLQSVELIQKIINKYKVKKEDSKIIFNAYKHGNEVERKCASLLIAILPAHSLRELAGDESYVTSLFETKDNWRMLRKLAQFEEFADIIISHPEFISNSIDSRQILKIVAEIAVFRPEKVIEFKFLIQMIELNKKSNIDLVLQIADSLAELENFDATPLIGLINEEEITPSRLICLFKVLKKANNLNKTEIVEKVLGYAEEGTSVPKYAFRLLSKFDIDKKYSTRMENLSNKYK